MAKPLVEQTADKLLKLIIERRYQVGDRLPNEYELAQDLEVGRSTIREAVRSLATRNILEVRQGSGTYISSKKGVSEDPLGFALIRDAAKLTDDLFELRLLLEPRIAEKVAIRATDEELADLEKLVIEIETSVFEGSSKHSELDVKFHSMLARISGNLAMDNLIPIINQSIVLINENFTNHQMKEDSLYAHREMMKAFKEHDPIAAHDATLRHILEVRKDAFADRT